MRRDILEAVSEVKDMIFPIFTNGTLIGPTYLEFLRTHLNMVPIISIEGNDTATDERRGLGVFQRAMRAMSSRFLATRRKPVDAWLRGAAFSTSGLTVALSHVLFPLSATAMW